MRRRRNSHPAAPELTESSDESAAAPAPNWDNGAPVPVQHGTGFNWRSLFRSLRFGLLFLLGLLIAETLLRLHLPNFGYRPSLVLILVKEFSWKTGEWLGRQFARLSDLQFLLQRVFELLEDLSRFLKLHELWISFRDVVHPVIELCKTPFHSLLMYWDEVKLMASSVHPLYVYLGSAILILTVLGLLLWLGEKFRWHYKITEAILRVNVFIRNTLTVQ